MFDFMFFVKTLIATVLIVSLLQIKAGETTLENHAARWIRTTPLTEPLQSTAAAGAKAVSDSARWLSAQFQKQTSRLFGSAKKNLAADADGLKLRRSAAYETEQRAKREAAARDDSGSEESE